MPKRVDANQKDIVNALRQIGCSVQSLHTVGKGCPDLLVGYKDMNLLIEVKVGDAKLNELEQKWHEGWAGDVVIANSPDEAIAVVRLAYITRYCNIGTRKENA